MRVKPMLMLLIILILSAVLIFIVYSRSGGETWISAPTGTPPTEETATPEPTVEPTVEPTPTPDPTPEPTPTRDPDLPDIDISEWQYRLVNTEVPLEREYEPEVTALEGNQSFDARAAQSLQDFVDDARAAGNSVIVTSSYRPYVTQEYLFNNKVNEHRNMGKTEETAIADASRIVARPGTSEHQLALAADIVDRYYDYLTVDFANTQLAQWMKSRCKDYGFILRYPEDKQDITKIMFEPWHFRYVGVEAATYIMEHGLCLEEFVALYE